MALNKRYSPLLACVIDLLGGVSLSSAGAVDSFKLLSKRVMCFKAPIKVVTHAASDQVPNTLAAVGSGEGQEPCLADVTTSEL